MATPGFKKEGGLIAQVDFGKAWTDAGRDPVMREVQDRYEEEAYFSPALKDSDDLGLTTALGVACVYDAIVQVDEEAVFRATKKDFAAVHEGRDKPADRTEEAQWLRFFLKERGPDPTALAPGEVPNGRVESFRQILDSLNLDLLPPVTFIYDGNTFTIGDPYMRMRRVDDSPPRNWRHPSRLLR
jgi:hypothetical protein